MFHDILLVIGTFGLIFLFGLLLFLVFWGLLSLYIFVFSDGYYSGLKDMLDDIKYCRQKISQLNKDCPKIK